MLNFGFEKVVIKSQLLVEIEVQFNWSTITVWLELLLLSFGPQSLPLEEVSPISY